MFCIINILSRNIKLHFVPALVGEHSLLLSYILVELSAIRCIPGSICFIIGATKQGSIIQNFSDATPYLLICIIGTRPGTLNFRNDVCRLEKTMGDSANRNQSPNQ